MSTVPSLSFCSISLSPPSWLEPYMTTFALPPSLALARLANSSADFANSDPGFADVAELDLELGEGGPRRQQRDEQRYTGYVHGFHDVLLLWNALCAGSYRPRQGVTVNLSVMPQFHKGRPSPAMRERAA